MGGTTSQQITYSVPIGSVKQGESRVYRKPGYENFLVRIPENKSKTLQQMMLHSVQNKGDSKCLGSKQSDGTYAYLSYKQVDELARQVGSGIDQLNLAPEVREFEDYSLKVIGVHAKNRAEWLILDITCAYYGYTLIPLYDTLGPDTIEYVIDHSSISTLFCQAETITALLKSKRLSRLKTIVTFDNISQEDMQIANKKNLTILQWKEVIKRGEKNLKDLKQIDPFQCFTFSYTSGTTGYPKGAMLSHSNFVSMIAASEQQEGKLLPSDVHLSYLPLPHVYERFVVWTYLFTGATICFYGGDMLKLKDDLAIVQPTVFPSVPRLFNKFCSAIQEKFAQTEGCASTLLDQALTTKLQNVQNDGSYTHMLWDSLVFKKTKAILGGRVRWMLTGSAPLSGSVINFMKVTMACPFVEGYGQTESTAGGFCTQFADKEGGHVGGPICSVEFKVVDVPEMGYTSLDVDENGINTPRGEICFRGPIVFMGYYKDRQKTQETIDKDGWLHSGDIGMIRPNGSLKIIDRKKNIFKLSQGEYIAPEKVENIYVRARGVEQVFVHGDSLQTYCIAVVVPNQAVFEKIAEENGIKESYQDLCRNQKMKKIMLDSLQALGKQEKLFGFEQAKKIILFPKLFNDIDCMTNTQKLKRHEARKYFKQKMDDLYAAGEP